MRKQVFLCGRHWQNLHRADLALDNGARGSGLREKVSAECGAKGNISRRRRVGNIVFGLGIAGGGTGLDAEGTVVEELVAHVGPGVGTITQRGVHGGVVESQGSIPPVESRANLLRGIGIRASNTNLKVRSPLSRIGSRGLVESAAPEGALDVCKSSRVGATITGLDGGISFEEDVEAKASLLVGTFLGAVVDIVAGLQDLVAQVTI